MPSAKSELLDRLPPQDLDAEKAVIGSLLHDPRMCDEVSAIIQPEILFRR